MRKAIPTAALVAASLLAIVIVAAQSRADEARALTNCSSSTWPNNSDEQTMLGLFNAVRAQHGVGPLTMSDGLNNAAAWIVEDMSHNGYFAHQPDSLGRSFATRMGQCDVGGYAGEVLTVGAVAPQSSFDLWMTSPGHRGAILSADFAYVGIAYYQGYWAAVFSSQPLGAPGPTPPPSPTATTPLPTPSPTPSPSPSPTPPAPGGPPQGFVPFLVRE